MDDDDPPIDDDTPMEDEDEPPPLEAPPPPPPADLPSEPEEEVDPPEEEEPPSEEEPPTDDDDDVPVKSAKWMPDWVRHRLDARQLRLVIEGVRQADGLSAASSRQMEAAAAGGDVMQGGHIICTSGLGFRDQLMHACLHAGYSAYFKLNMRALKPSDPPRYYHAVPSDDHLYTPEEMQAAVLVDPRRKFKGVRPKHDNYWVCYDEQTSELLPAQDVRFDGKACIIREKQSRAKGWVAVHTTDGTVRHAASQEGLAAMLSVKQSALAQARRRGGKIRGEWTILTAAEHDQANAQQQAIAIPTQAADLYDKERDGRVWCVRVDHPDHLVFVQRAHRDSCGVVTKVGRTVIVGNCQIDMIELPRLRLSFAARTVTVDGRAVNRLYSSDHVGLYISQHRSVQIDRLMRGINHALLLENDGGEMFIMVPAAALPSRPRLASQIFPTNLVFDRRNRDWLGHLDVRHYLYPVSLSRTFMSTPTLAAALYLLLLRFLDRQYEQVFKLIDSCVTDTRLSQEEFQIFDNLQRSSEDYHPTPTRAG